MVWDRDDKGNILAVQLKSFEVAAYPDDNLVLLRLLVGSTNVQIALNKEFAAALSRDLAVAAATAMADQSLH